MTRTTGVLVASVIACSLHAAEPESIDLIGTASDPLLICSVLRTHDPQGSQWCYHLEYARNIVPVGPDVPMARLVAMLDPAKSYEQSAMQPYLGTYLCRKSNGTPACTP